MAQKMSDVYKFSLREQRAILSRKIRENDDCYNALTIKESEYARAVKALGDLHRAAYKIYRDAPDEI